MNALLIVKLIVGVILFLTWVALEYCPPKVADVDSLKTFIKMTLGGLVGHLVSGGASQ